MNYFSHIKNNRFYQLSVRGRLVYRSAVHPPGPIIFQHPLHYIDLTFSAYVVGYLTTGTQTHNLS